VAGPAATPKAAARPAIAPRNRGKR
jgi:hypothetical protein